MTRDLYVVAFFTFTFASPYVIARQSVCLPAVCNVRAPNSGDWNFR